MTPIVTLYDGAAERARQAVEQFRAGLPVGIDSGDILREFLRLWDGPVSFRSASTDRVLDRTAVGTLLASGVDVFRLEEYTG